MDHLVHNYRKRKAEKLLGTSERITGELQQWVPCNALILLSSISWSFRYGRGSQKSFFIHGFHHPESQELPLCLRFIISERKRFFLQHDKCRDNILGEKKKKASEVLNHLLWLPNSRFRLCRHFFCYRPHREKPVISRERNALMSALHSYSLIFFLHCFHSSKHPMLHKREREEKK